MYITSELHDELSVPPVHVMDNNDGMAILQSTVWKRQEWEISEVSDLYKISRAAGQEES